MLKHKHDKVKSAQAKKDRDDLKKLPPGNSVVALRARVDLIEKILGLA